MQEKDYLLSLTQSEVLGPSRLQYLRGLFNTWEEIWQAPASKLRKATLPPPVLDSFLKYRRNFNLKKSLYVLKKHQIDFITIDEPNYPNLLKNVPLPPPLLYYQGDLDIFKLRSIAVVGSRKSTPYGRGIIQQIVPELTSHNYLIISGLALGTDTLVHQTTLYTNGLTAAILPSSLDTIYPPTNTSLAKEIRKQGCLISEYKPGTAITKGNFIRRNRLIAGLTGTTVVIEPQEKSGSLVTAEWARKYHRPVIFFTKNSSVINNFQK